MKKTPTPAKRKAVSEHDEFLGELNKLRNPQGIKRKAAVKKAPSLAVTIAKMQKQQPGLTQKMDKLLNKIAKLASAVAKHEQAEAELRNLMTGSGFAVDYYDYLLAKQEEDRDNARWQ